MKMKGKKFLFRTSIVLNVLFLIVFGYLVMQRGGIPYLYDKVTSAFGAASAEFESDNVDYSRKQSIYDLTTITEGSIVFLGDSIIDGASWAELFQSTEYVNRGIPGDNSKGVLNRLDDIVESHPSKVFAMIGVNDLHADGDYEELLRNYKAIIDRIKNESPETEIYVHSILPYYPEKYELANTTKMSNELIETTNIELKKLSEEKGTNFIDLFSSLASDSKELNPDYTYDGLHLNGEAYMIWKNELEGYLK